MEKGFYIANKSQPNYIHTNFSIISSLNMRYVNFLFSGKYTDKQINELYKESKNG